MHIGRAGPALPQAVHGALRALGDGVTDVVPEPVPGVRPVRGRLDIRDGRGVEYVQRLIRRFRYQDMALAGGSAGRAALVAGPQGRKRTRTTSTGCPAARFADVQHPELERSAALPGEQVGLHPGLVDHRGGARRCSAEDDKLLRGGWPYRERSTPLIVPNGLPALPFPADASPAAGVTPGGGGTAQRGLAGTSRRRGRPRRDAGAEGCPPPRQAVSRWWACGSWTSAWVPGPSAGRDQVPSPPSARTCSRWSGRTHPDSGRGTLVPEGGRAGGARRPPRR